MQRTAPPGARVCHRSSHGRGSRCGRPGQREQPGGPAAHHRGRQQRERIHIRGAPQQPPVQTTGRTVPRPRRQARDDLARDHLRPHRQQGLDRLVRHPQRWLARIGEDQRQHAPPADPPRERDPPRAHRPHLSAGRGSQVHAPMPGSVRRRGRLPAADDPGPSRTDRPLRPHGPAPLHPARPLRRLLHLLPVRQRRSGHPRPRRRPRAPGPEGEHRRQREQQRHDHFPVRLLARQPVRIQHSAVHATTVPHTPAPQWIMPRICG